MAPDTHKLWNETWIAQEDRQQVSLLQMGQPQQRQFWLPTLQQQQRSLQPWGVTAEVRAVSTWTSKTQALLFAVTVTEQVLSLPTEE